MAGPSDVDANNCFGRLSNYYQQNLSGINELKKEIEKLKAEGTEATDKNEEMILESNGKPKRELKTFDGKPTSANWNNVRLFASLLQVFYELTLKVSGSLYVTSNTFAHEISYIHTILKEWQQSDDIDVYSMGIRMKNKFDKYWGDPEKVNKLLYIAVVLDPRHKLDFVEFMLIELYGDEKGAKVGKIIKDTLFALYKNYKEKIEPQCGTSIVSSIPKSVDNDNSSTNMSDLKRQSIIAKYKKQKAQVFGNGNIFLKNHNGLVFFDNTDDTMINGIYIKPLAERKRLGHGEALEPTALTLVDLAPKSQGSDSTRETSSTVWRSPMSMTGMKSKHTKQAAVVVNCTRCWILQFELERGEYINGMFGSFNDYYGEVCITELGFKTNLGNDHGPFGGGGGEGFSVPVVAGRIVGFFGEYDRYINSIGVSLALN
ncbi:hypothetical protein ZIOFF_016760 [Zingiber officinale]|uniref:Jacalin-type lectin domain-containing protein n=1 Tax=Zingiber officinale TaxID=94328 RepID=A0A8J5HWJ2_ZINOF|nr:hypothetical protein ZIOFF_016760 [Zingiber officinale]